MNIPRDAGTATDNSTLAKTRQKNRSFKRLLVFCDGTGQQTDAPVEMDKDDACRAVYNKYEEWVPASNITRLCTLVAKSQVLEDGREIPQITFYQNGVATGSGTALAKSVASGVGTGLNDNVAEAYVWLLNNWVPGDEIFVFGFSRGAFTARAIAGLICNVGFGTSDMCSFPKMYDAYMHRIDSPEMMKQWNDICNVPEREKEEVPIKVVGVWDTVASLGLPIKSLNKISGWEKSHSFHDVQPQNNIENMFHALALDEERPSFSPTLMFLPPNSMCKTNLKQCWFPGVHSDVGGSYRDAQDLDSSDLSLAWMITQCQGLVAFDEHRLGHWLNRRQTQFFSYLPSMYAAMPSHDSVTGIFKVDGREPRKPGEYLLEDLVTDKAVPGVTLETIHPSVRARLLKLHDKGGRWKKRMIQRKEPKYGFSTLPFHFHWGQPKEEFDFGTIEYTLEWDAQPLAGWKLVRVEAVGKKPTWKWVKEKDGKRLEIPEWVMEDDSLEMKLLRKDDEALLADVAASKKLPAVIKDRGVVGNAFHAIAHDLPGHKHQD